MTGGLSFAAALVLLSLAADARAGELEGEASVDHLAAYARGDEEHPLLSAGELGVRLRGSLRPSPVWAFRWDYRGRQPIYGTHPNAAMHLLYLLDATASSQSGRVAFGVGRFPAPSVVLLPVDGARLELRGQRAALTAFGGRRAISTSRKNIPIDTLLPAAGVETQLKAERGRIDLGAAAYEDQLTLGTSTSGSVEPYATWNGKVAATLWPIEGLTVGGRAVASPRVVYEFPTSEGYDWVVTATDLYDLVGWAQWAPWEHWRFGGDLLRQHALVESATAPELSPDFIDIRARAAWGPEGVGWFRAEAIRRLRVERTESRGRIQVDLNDLGPLFAGGRVELVDVSGANQPDDVGAIDRLYWNLGGGVRAQRLEFEAGLSFLERALYPVSSTEGDLLSTEPQASEDLALYVMEAQSVLYARGFFAARSWFLGVDLERNLRDAELRGFLQVGATWDARW